MAEPAMQTPRRSIAAENVTPARMTRLEERKDLQELNRRLEQYILRQRERDAQVSSMQRDIDTAKSKFEQDRLNDQRLFEAQLAEARSQRDRIQQLLEETQSELSR